MVDNNGGNKEISLFSIERFVDKEDTAGKSVHLLGNIRLLKPLEIDSSILRYQT